MSQYWLVSAPADGSKENTFKCLNNATSVSSDLSDNYRFNIPELKVGTLDSLMSVSDDMIKVDQYMESVIRKLTSQIVDLLDDHKDKIPESFQVHGVDPNQFLCNFEWDSAKYPVKNSVSDLSDLLSKTVSDIESSLRNKVSAYTAVRNNIQSIDRKATGNLLVRTLDDIVKKEMFVQDSENLTTLVVAVPKALFKDWKIKYETLTKMVVPRSTELIAEDNEYGLFTVTLFTRVVDEFKNVARENKFTVRDFIFNEESLKHSLDEKEKLEVDLKKLWSTLVRWCRTNFGEAFSAWIHLKALRVFVESVLRYGLPANFQAVVMKPIGKNDKKLRDTLNKLYAHLDRRGGVAGGPDVEIPGFTHQEYYPYVYFKVPFTMFEGAADF
eukprot:Nk52_evm47s1401 gene=Nk52_evmTU47s1401